MLNFFRKIRQNLLSEGNTGKYLKYALGEIVLVVIGILIALQINDWNQQKILENQSQQILLNLQEEINESKTELEVAINFLQQRVRKNLEYLNNSEQNIADSIKISKIRSMVFFYAESIKLPILESELGPNKKVFQWPELTKSMQNLSESIEYYNKGIEFIENDVQSNQLPYLVKEGVIIDLMVSDRILDSKDYKNADIYNDENFRSVIASSTFMMTGLLEGAKRVIDNYTELLLIIKQKIE